MNHNRSRMNQFGFLASSLLQIIMGSWVTSAPAWGDPFRPILIDCDPTGLKGQDIAKQCCEREKKKKSLEAWVEALKCDRDIEELGMNITSSRFDGGNIQCQMICTEKANYEVTRTSRQGERVKSAKLADKKSCSYWQSRNKSGITGTSRLSFPDYVEIFPGKDPTQFEGCTQKPSLDLPRAVCAGVATCSFVESVTDYEITYKISRKNGVTVQKELSRRDLGQPRTKESSYKMAIACEASGDGSCPSPTECWEKGAMPGHSVNGSKHISGLSASGVGGFIESGSFYSPENQEKMGFSAVPPQNDRILVAGQPRLSFGSTDGPKVCVQILTDDQTFSHTCLSDAKGVCPSPEVCAQDKCTRYPKEIKRPQDLDYPVSAEQPGKVENVENSL